MMICPPPSLLPSPLIGEYKNSQEWFITRETQDIRVVRYSNNCIYINTCYLSLSLSLPPPPSLPLPPSPLSHCQGVVGTEHSLKSALVTAFSDGELDLEGDERGKRKCILNDVIITS